MLRFGRAPTLVSGDYGEPMSGPKTVQEHEGSGPDARAITAESAAHLGWAGVVAALRSRLESPTARQDATGPNAGFASSWQPALVRQAFAELDGLQAQIQTLAEQGRGTRWLPASLRDVVPLEDALGRVARGGILEPIDLLDVSRVLAAAVAITSLHPDDETVVGAGAPDDPGAPGRKALRAALEGLCADEPLAQRLARSVEVDGEDATLSDDASPELAQARAHARRARQELAAAAAKMVARPDMADALADRFWTERQGRVVLPVKAGALSRGRGASGVAGIIHGSSTSGQTFFVEPTGLVEDNNRVRQAQAHARAEERRVLAALSSAIAERADDIATSVQAMARLDRIVARLRLSEQLEGITPEVFAPHEAQAQTGLRLESARHPLMVLAGVEVVPNDLSLGLGQGLIISGPNAGGKTVALKTIGLCVLMAQLGLRLPTRTPAQLPLYRFLVTDVGDDQSIAANLSTFTAHLRHVQRALDAAQADAAATLVLLDEVAVGTDPEQGAALAEAIVLRLVESGASVVATTHYERLKLLATRDQSRQFVNASVGFDLANLRPTFEVRIGLPGSSSALAVARRLGLPEPMLRHAEGLLSEPRLAVDVLLSELEGERVALAQTRQILDQERGEMARARARLDARERGEEEGEAKRRARAHRKAISELGELEAEIRRRRQSLRKAKLDPAPDGQAPAADADARSFVGAARQQARAHEPQPTAPVSDTLESVTVGQRVLIAALGAKGDVVAVKGSRVTVQLPTLKTTVKLAELRRAGPAPKKSRPRPAPAPRPSRARRYFGADAAVFDPGLDDTVDVRGQRAEEAVTMMEVFLDRALAEDHDVVLIRHGHGSGALRKMVREALGRLRHVARHRAGLPAEGGDAVTVVWVQG